ncbi:MAG: hypothetical protein QOJ19_2139 [Acidimicrobiia bacterium]|nr:hypothetical protein [Acidimicrobiia bacterium]
MFVSRHWGRQDQRLLTVICAVAALFAFVSYLMLFRHGSLNNDEVAYLQQAKAIRRGHLFLDVRPPAAAHRIWFFVERDPGLVSKYLPFVSAIFALGLLTFGSVAPVLAILAGVLPWLVAELAVELDLDRPHALAAAALVSLSPLVLMESALPLSYLPFLVAVTAAWLLVVRLGTGRAGARSALLLGLVASAAAGARPYDAVLLLVPMGLWAVWRRKREAVRLAGFALLGALPLGLVTAVYDTMASGRPWTPPFGLLEPSDTLGFGVRKLYPEQTAHDFGPVRGLIGLRLHFGQGLPTWLALGFLLIPAAVVAWRTAGGATRALLFATVVHLVGYWAFWGPWFFSVQWAKGTRVLGPIYALPLVVPLVLAGLPVLARWWERRPRVIGGLIAVGVLVAAAQLVSAVGQAAIDASRTNLLLSLARKAQSEGPLLFDADPPYLGHPVSQLVDGISLSPFTAVPDPGATEPQLLQLPQAVYGTGTLAYALTHEQRVESSEVYLDVRLMNLEARLVKGKGDRLVVERAGQTGVCPLPIGATIHVTLTPSASEGCSGMEAPAKWLAGGHRRCPDTACLALAVYRLNNDGTFSLITWRSLPVRTTANRVALLVDGPVVASSGNGWLRVAPS